MKVIYITKNFYILTFSIEVVRLFFVYKTVDGYVTIVYNRCNEKNFIFRAHYSLQSTGNVAS